MGKRRRRRREAALASAPVSRRRTYLIGLLALVGVALSAYLTYAYLAGGKAAFCEAGSSCDVVQSSRYSRFLGIPVPILGLAGFAAIAAASLAPLRGREKGLAVYLLALGGFAFSAYLTYLEIFVITALCPYCLVSFLLMGGILVAALTARPIVPGLRSGQTTWAGLAMVAVVLVFSVAVYAAQPTATEEEEQSYAASLARHLTEQGVVMYGAWWCPACAKQKELFGGAFKHVNYVECEPGGSEPPQQARCEAKGIRQYPTWEIFGRLYVGVFALNELAQLTEFHSEEGP